MSHTPTKSFTMKLVFTSNVPDGENPEHYLETAVEYEPHQLTALDIDNFGEVATTALKHNLKRRGLLQEESHATRQNN